MLEGLVQPTGIGAHGGGQFTQIGGRSQTLAQDLACRSKQNLVEIGSVTRHRFIFRGCGRRAGRRVDLVGQTEVDSYPQLDLFKIERFGYVVHRAFVQTGNPVLRHGSGGEKNHRDLAGLSVCLEAATGG